MKLFGGPGSTNEVIGFSVKTVHMAPKEIKTRSTTMFLFPDNTAHNYIFGDDDGLFIEADNTDRIADDMLV